MEDTSLQSVFSGQEATPQEPVQETAPEPVEQATGEEVAAAPAEPPDDPMERHRKGLEAAAVAERTKRQAAEQRAQALEQQLQRFQQQQQPAQADGFPDPSQYTDAVEFAKDYAKAQVAQERKAWQQEAQRDQMARDIDSRANAVIADGRGKYQDFDQSLESLRPMLVEGDFRNALVLRGGPDVAYHLSKDLAEAYRIASLPTPEMVLELAELRGMLKGRPAVSSPPPPAPAPAPIPRTLTDVRNASGQFAVKQTEITPLEAILGQK